MKRVPVTGMSGSARRRCCTNSPPVVTAPSTPTTTTVVTTVPVARVADIVLEHVLHPKCARLVP
jgi:hypothetical protein